MTMALAPAPASMAPNILTRCPDREEGWAPFL